MKKDGQVLVVHCFFTEEGEKLPELMAEYLRLFIERNLPNRAKFDDRAAKYYNIHDNWPLISGGITCT